MLLGSSGLYDPIGQVDRQILLFVADNAIVVVSGGDYSSFASLDSAKVYIEAKIAERREKIAARAKPSSGFSPMQFQDLLNGFAAAAGVPPEKIQEMIRARIGIEPWQMGEPPTA